jgi:hypothetical protein
MFTLFQAFPWLIWIVAPLLIILALSSTILHVLVGGYSLLSEYLQSVKADIRQSQDGDLTRAEVNRYWLLWTCKTILRWGIAISLMLTMALGILAIKGGEWLHVSEENAQICGLVSGLLAGGLILCLRKRLFDENFWAGVLAEIIIILTLLLGLFCVVSITKPWWRLEAGLAVGSLALALLLIQSAIRGHFWETDSKWVAAAWLSFASAGLCMTLGRHGLVCCMSICSLAFVTSLFLAFLSFDNSVESEATAAVAFLCLGMWAAKNFLFG